jgi:hypothetical protein
MSNFNKLVNLAVKEFISKPHAIELAFDEQAKKAIKKHKDAMEKLK